MIEHPFQRAGLGLAPFKCIGVVEKTYQSCPGAPIQGAGTCDYCGMGIRFVVQVRSSDGKEFGIGMDCASKLYKDYNQQKSKEDDVAKVIREHKNKCARESRQKRESAIIARLSEDVSHHVEKIRSLPHPNKYFADKGKSLFDYLEWHKINAGRTGFIAALKYVDRMINKEEIPK